MKLSKRSLNYEGMKMLTVKQDGKRIVNPELYEVDVVDASKDSLFKILAVECGFQASKQIEVWAHTKEGDFKVRLDSDNNIFLFKYKHLADKYEYPSKSTNREFISNFLESSRNFFSKIQRSE